MMLNSFSIKSKQQLARIFVIRHSEVKSVVLDATVRREVTRFVMEGHIF